MLKMILVWLLAALLTANAVTISVKGNFNAGVVLVWAASAMVILYGIFHRQIDAFCAQGAGRVLKIVFLAGMLVFAGLFAFVAVSGYTDGAKGDEKAIIVLGAAVHGEQVSGVLHRRLTAAHEAWLQNPGACIVVTGGQGHGEAIPEAVAMERWMLARGVPPDKIIVEDKSTSTEQNLLFAKQLLAQKGVEADAPVAVVTNAFHCYRAGKYAEKAGYADVRNVPASMSAVSILPSYAREVLAILYMWVFRR